MRDRLQHDQYTIRRKVLTLTGASFHVFDPEGRVVFFSRLKAFKLKEDISLYADESRAEELLTMKARQLMDFGATYDVFDCQTQVPVGSLRRKGMKSLLRDEWLLFDPDGRKIAIVREDSAGLAALRRIHDVFTLIAPQAFHMEHAGREVCRFRQNRNPFVHRLYVEFAPDMEPGVDRRLGLAAGILLSAIEGRQSS